MHTAIPEDIPLSFPVARHYFAREVQVLYQPCEVDWKPRALRSGFEEKTVPANRGDDSAGAILGL
jgi:hypothetical protein